MSDIYDLKLPEKLVEVLKVMVKMAEESQVLTLDYAILASTDPTYRIGAGDRARRFTDLKENPFFALEAVGMIKIIPETHNTGKMFLTARLYHWLSYRDKGAVGKWIERNTQSGKDTILAVVTIITTALAVLQILELLGI